MISKFYKNTLRISLTIIAGLSIGMGIASPAFAGSSIPNNTTQSTSSTSTSTTTVGSGIVPPGKPSGGGKKSLVIVIPCMGINGGGAIMALQPDGEGWPLVTSGCMPEYKVTSTFVPSPGGCAARTLSGGTVVQAKGHFIHNLTYLTYGNDGAKWYYQYLNSSTSKTCVYPIVKQTTRTIDCIISGKVRNVREANSFAGYKAWKLQTVNFGSKAEILTNNKCVQVATINYTNETAQGDSKNWGQYTLHSSFQKLRCKISVETFDGVSRELYRSCSKLPDTLRQSPLSLWCSGYDYSYVGGKTWTPQDCKNVGWVCNVGTPTFNGKTPAVETLRNGKNGSLVWGAPNPRAKGSGGIRYSKNWETLDTLVKNSSPYNDKVSVNNKNSQYFVYEKGTSTTANLNSWNKNKTSTSLQDINLRFYNASNPGGKFQIQRQTRFRAQVLGNIYRIADVNPETGKITMKESKKWIDTPSNEWLTCNTQTTPRITAVRTIGSAY